MTELSPQSRNFVSQFGGRSAGLPWLDDLRAQGGESFAAAGLPTPRIEEWKYTSLRGLEEFDFQLAEDDAAAISIDKVTPLLADGEGASRLVFVNGHFRADLSAAADLPNGVRVTSLGQAFKDRLPELEEHLGHIAGDDLPPLTALNGALFGDGFVVILDQGAVAGKPIEVISIGCANGAPVAFHPRNLIIAKGAAEATIVEHHYGLGGVTFANAVTEIVADNGATVRHYRIQNDGIEAFNLATVVARVGRDAAYESFVGMKGARLSRSDIRVILGAPGAEVRLDGVYALDGTQHADNTTMIEHAAANTTSHETYKGALDGASRGVFRGCILVHRDAQKTDGSMTNKTLLLSDDAEIDSKPQLEIFADDVKCSHGATVGEIDGDALFYLRSRGIPEEAARTLLVEAFLAEVIVDIPVAGVCRAAMALFGAGSEEIEG